MVRKNKIEASPHYNEIVDLLVAGYKPRYVSEYLLEEYDEKISHTTLNKYKKEKLNIKAAVKKKVIEKEKSKKTKSNVNTQKVIDNAIETEVDKTIRANESFEAAVDFKFNDIKKLDDVIDSAEKIQIDFDKCKTADKIDPYRELDLMIKFKKLGLDAIRLKHDLLDDDESDVNVNINNVMTLEESLERTRQKYQEAKNSG